MTGFFNDSNPDAVQGEPVQTFQISSSQVCDHIRFKVRPSSSPLLYGSSRAHRLVAGVREALLQLDPEKQVIFAYALASLALCSGYFSNLFWLYLLAAR